MEAGAHGNPAKSASPAQDAVPSKAASKASSTRNSTPAATSVETHPPVQNPAHPSFPMEDVQPPHETSNGASNGAQSSSKESDQNGEVPSSYGTRSRNRPGRLRPNYAEDTEMDFEMGAASANGNLSDPPSRNSVAPDNLHFSGVSGKKGPGPVQGDTSWGNSGSNARDHPPPSANPPSANPSSANPPSANPPSATASPASLPATAVAP